ncbi:MAG: histidine kinase [Phycisphaerae bacterium]|nr:histidine kinase [Phycisphaerae bacterium]
MRRPSAAGGWPAILYTLKMGSRSGGLLRMWKALRTRNACKTCALGMGGQKGGMVNESGHFPEVCKKSVQAMAADMAGAIRPGFFSEFPFQKMRGLGPRELESAGRLTEPLFAGPLDQGYRAISWDDSMKRIIDSLKATSPDETFFYFSGRSSNEAAFLLQLLARFYGTNNVNNCSYYCHQASGVGLSSVTGSGTATIDLEDIDRCDTMFLIGGNPASNHPRFMRSLMDLKRRGGRVIVINPMKELGLERFKVPSDVRSLLFGTRICDEYLQLRIGSDIAAIVGIAKQVLREDAVDHEFVTNHCEGWEQWRRFVEECSWDSIENSTGLGREQLQKVGSIYARSERTILAWTMGITHHAHGVANVQSIAALAMMRGMLGRPGCGLLPLRGHSNVQGIGSVGATPVLKKPILDAVERRFETRLPEKPGMDTLECMERASAGGVRVAFCLGGNLFGSNPDSVFASEALRQVDLVVYLSTTLNTGHACGLGRETIVLPVQARDEERQSTTQESMFNFIRMSDGGQQRHEGPRSEVDVILDVAEGIVPDAPLDFDACRDHAAIRELIASVIPGWGEIGSIDSTRREFTVDGRVFHEPRFPTESGKARFHVVDPPSSSLEHDQLQLMTVRSEGQFNTVVYEEEDLYRGQERRDVILMNPSDIHRLGLQVDQHVTVHSEAGSMDRILVRPFDIAIGCACMYYPEANILIPRSVDPASRTPAFKSVAITIES